MESIRFGVSRILCLDVGSSSVKFALYDITHGREQLLLDRTLESDGTAIADVCAAISAEVEQTDVGIVDAVGHRIVYGAEHAKPVAATRDVVQDLRRFIPLDPLHQAPQLIAVEKLQHIFPAAPHVLCFDSAFFHAMPKIARRLPIPDIGDPLVRRYGFHGLSYEFIVSNLGPELGGKAIIAHLGNGASLCALHDGSPVDTTMGFTPLGGIMMGTRPGDLDPGIVLYLLNKGYTSQRFTDLLYRESGLLGVSGIASDMRTLLERAATDERAAFAIDLFVYLLCKHLGALITVLGSLDMLVFTGGIGENAGVLRDRIVNSLSFLRTRPEVRVIRTNENLMIARHVAAFLAPSKAGKYLRRPFLGFFSG